MKFLSFLLLIVVILVGAAFAMLNSQIVNFNFYFGEKRLALSMLLALSLLIGILLGGVFCVWRLLKQRFEIRRLRRRLNSCRQEVTNLRHIPIKDQD